MTVSSNSSNSKPVFGLLLMGGALTGAMVRDVRLANELVARGYTVHAWWIIDRPRESPFSREVQEHWLAHGLRWLGIPDHQVLDHLGRLISRVFNDRARARMAQRRPALQQRMMTRLTAVLCDGVERDRGLIAGFASQLQAAGVTHALPMISPVAPFMLAARQAGNLPMKLLVTFQGYELFATYALAIDREKELYRRLFEAVEQSDFPAIAVSTDYLDRVRQDIGVPVEKLRAIEPGVPAATKIDGALAQKLIADFFGVEETRKPIISYVGRQDAEKGIDLLLYAAVMLRARGYDFELYIGGPSLFGVNYHETCKQIAEHLRLKVNWQVFVPQKVRDALFSVSTCIVYPAIHREPFGMVAAEALSYGTPAIVPAYGGVEGAISANGAIGGLTFKAFDSADLARAIAQILDDPALRQRLSAAGPQIAEHYSVANMTDRVLDHLGLPRKSHF